jgi:predicted RNA-binding protein with PUA-like domain
MSIWIMKSEPDEFSIDDLARRGVEAWTGVRNFQARNFMRDDMQVGDQVFFYHSSCAEPGIAGIAQISTKAYADPTQFDPKSIYYDERSQTQIARWSCVDVRFVRKLNKPITLSKLKAFASKLEGLVLLRPGNRLSIMPVSMAHYRTILKLEEKI